MTAALAAACLWAIAANVAAMLPSRRHHWPQAVALVVAGIPILGWVTSECGPLWGVVILAAGVSVLRWPVFRLWQWLRAGGRRQAAVTGAAPAAASVEATAAAAPPPPSGDPG